MSSENNDSIFERSKALPIAFGEPIIMVKSENCENS